MPSVGGGNPPFSSTAAATAAAMTDSPASTSASAAEAPKPAPPTTHRANCHCGHTKYKVTLEEPFPQYKINRCTCSVCHKNGYLLVYPQRRHVEWISGYEDLGEYRFGTRRMVHKFCKKCGSSIMIDFCLTDKFPDQPEKDEIAINTRMFTDIDFEKDELNWRFWDGKNKMNPKYNPEEFWGDENSVEKL